LDSVRLASDEVVNFGFAGKELIKRKKNRDWALVLTAGECSKDGFVKFELVQVG
jgi:hypothetical protein